MSRRNDVNSKNFITHYAKSFNANNKVKRRFLPSVKKVSFKSELLNKKLKITVSNAAMRSIDKKGSFDQFMKTVKSKNLSIRLKKIKKSIIQKSA